MREKRGWKMTVVVVVVVVVVVLHWEQCTAPSTALFLVSGGEVACGSLTILNLGISDGVLKVKKKYYFVNNLWVGPFFFLICFLI